MLQIDVDEEIINTDFLVCISKQPDTEKKEQKDMFSEFEEFLNNLSFVESSLVNLWNASNIICCFS